MSDCILCIYTSENEDIAYLLERNGINNPIFIDSISELLQLRFIDILFVCDDKSQTLYKYIDFIKTKHKNIKIICVVKKDDHVLSNKLIEHDCDCIIKKDKKCSVSLSDIINKIKKFIELYNKQVSFKRLYNRRKQNIKSYRRRKEDYMVTNYVY
jgi:predicted ATP-dependent serine protease